MNTYKLKSGRSSSFRLSLVGLILTAVLALFLSQAILAFAHARLKSANVGPDALVATAPASLSLTFSEETSTDQTKLQVLDATGKAVDKGDLKVSGATATVSLGTLADGKYTVKFRSFTEDDGGIIEGQYTFSVAKTGTAASGDVAKASQEESNVPAAPNTGVGGAGSPALASTEGWLVAFGLSLGLAATGLTLKEWRMHRRR